MSAQLPVYRNIQFERRGDSLMLRLHTDGGALKWGAAVGSIHWQLGDAFRHVARDQSVRVVILTGTGDAFCSGVNRARYFLMTGQRLTAQQACDLGVVAEVLPLDKLLSRAWDLAADLERKPPAALRNTRAALTHHIKKRMLEELDHGLALESVAALAYRRG